MQYVFGIKHLNINNAADAEKILTSTKHLDKSYYYKFLHGFMHEGLITANKEKWQVRRKLLTPVFYTAMLKDFFEVFCEESDRMVEELRGKAGETVETWPIMMRHTLNMICLTNMGIRLSDYGAGGEAYRKGYDVFKDHGLIRLVKPWLFADALYKLFGYQKELDAAIGPAANFTKSIIAQRKKMYEDSLKNDSGEKKRKTMLDVLLEIQREGLIDDHGILEECETFTVAGHDTIAGCMTFASMLLGVYPEHQERILEEIEATVGDSTEFTYDEINRMDFLNRFVKETMRLYPPVQYISRELAEDVQWDNELFPKGTTCQIHLYDVMHDPACFKDPQKFDPDRFLPENSVGRNSFAYIPFSGGIRPCIGQKTAYVEIKVIIAKLVKNFRIVSHMKEKDYKLTAGIVLGTKPLIKVEFHPRM